MTEVEIQVIRTALRWFREMLRRDSLEDHELPLFNAIAELRIKHQSVDRLPTPPRLPSEMSPPPDEEATGTTYKDLAMQGETLDLVTTKPVPPDTQDELLVESILEGIEAYRKG